MFDFGVKQDKISLKHKSSYRPNLQEDWIAQSMDEGRRTSFFCKSKGSQTLAALGQMTCVYATVSLIWKISACHASSGLKSVLVLFGKPCQEVLPYLSSLQFFKG